MPAEEIADGADNPPVADATPPRLIFPASNLVFDSQSEVGMTVTYNIAALDDIDGEVTPECSPPSGAKFPIGKVNVICTATDAAGNTILGSFILEVRLIPTSTVDTNVFAAPGFTEHGYPVDYRRSGGRCNLCGSKGLEKDKSKKFAAAKVCIGNSQQDLWPVS
jgi:hypothetical protein